jgi:hypothetical protein
VIDIYVAIGWDINKARLSLWSVHCKYGNSLYIVYVMNYFVGLETGFSGDTVI